MHATVRWGSGVAILLAALWLLDSHSAAGFAEEGAGISAGMPPGKSLGDHRCIHDKIALDHLPTIQTKGGSHEKRFATGFSPIRITPRFIEPLSSTFRSQLTNETGALMKVLSFISHTLLVRPISGNVTIPPTCDEYAFGPNEGKCRILHSTTQCGPYIVPNQFLGPRQVCTSLYGSCHESGAGGGGEANTDLLLFVGTQASCSSSSTLAFASACAMDQWHRPSAGYLTLCPSNLIANTNAENIPEVLFNLILHEISHALGFSQSQFENFHDGNLNFYRPDTTGYYDGSTITGLNSPKVLQVARNYFGCRDLPFVPLENGGSIDGVSSHWEARVLHHESMAPFLSNDFAVFSNFTLAFFEDSGWYKVNYTFINNYDQFELQWGKGLGCEFILESCNNPNTYPYLCDTAVLHQCTFDHMAKGTCQNNYAFFDGCPVVIADEETACIHSTNTPVPNYGSEVYGEGSICVEVNSTLGDCLPLGGTPRCYQRRIVQQPTTNEVAFAINVCGSTYWCRDSEVLETSDGFVFCPSRDEILLRVSEEDISPVQSLPVPANIAVTNTSAQELLGGSGSGAIDISVNISVLEECPAPERRACIRGDIRLVGGSTPYEGRVEVCRNDEWGTVCDDGWGTTDARVVCRQLGFETQGARAYSYAFFGRGIGPIHLMNVGCTGTESRLFSCHYSASSIFYCGHYEDAGVRCQGPCQNGSLRVVDTHGIVSRQGNVELCIYGRWRMLCANSWDNRDASVVCRQIGYSPHGAVALENVYPSSNHRFINTEVNCSGLELKITNCIQNLDEAYSCLSFGIASVSCHTGILPNASCVDGGLRLNNFYIPGEGRVEICINNAWGTVCDDGWDNADASVVCRQLGYYPIGKAMKSAFFGNGRGPILMEYVRCSGFEESLLDCDHNGLGLSTCGHWEDAGVVCQVNPPVDLTANCTLGDVRLMNGTSELGGRVEVCFGDLWGTICHNSWDNRDAGVICKQLFNSSFGGYAINGSSFGSGDVPTVVGSINCSGTEQMLTDCQITSTAISSCNESTVAGILCFVFQEEVSITCSNGAVRLADGLTEHEGRVEICYDNHWGGVCGNSWDTTEATVVCRQLGHIFIGITAFTNSYFGVGLHHPLIQIVSCSGSESSLLTCSHTQLGSDPHCKVTSEVGVRCIDPSTGCTPGDVRLVDGTNPYQGTVEVCLYGVWSTVCDSNWVTADASVVCRQLGLSSIGAISHRYGYYGRGSGPILMSNVLCSGSETHLINCSHSTGSTSRSCSHFYDVGVECPVPTNDTCTTNGDLRLVGGTNQYEGRVEVCYNRQWGTVCDDSWGAPDAGVACRQLGHSGIGATAYSLAHFGRGSGGIYLDNLGCSGKEFRLIDCSHSPIGVHNCDHSADAGIRCPLRRNDCTHGQIRLEGGSASRSGRVEICVDGTWGTVCDDGWSYSDARVACRQLGFPTLGTVVRTNAYYGPGSGLIMLTNVGCTGEERNLLNCTHTGYGVTSCSHSEDAGVSCPAPILNPVNCTDGELRLRGSTTPRRGRVEMCYEGQWGTVCDDSWGTNDAKVACRQLGFSSYGATAYSSAYFGRGTGPILLDDVECTGGESRLLDCSKYHGVGIHNCGHSEDAGVACNALGTECEDGSIRLRGGLGARQGRVEICVEGRWGTICDTSWNSRDAAVACRQLGYPPIGSIPRMSAFYGQGSGPIWLGQSSCTGNEVNLLNCSHSGIGITQFYCGHSNDVGVECPAIMTGTCTTGAVRLVGGTTTNEGRVEICYDNQWGTVCDDSWSNIDARVVCRQLGYSTIGAIAYTNAYFGRGSGGIFMDNVGCRGTESTLLSCPYSGVGVHNCDHSADAGSSCFVLTNCTEGQIRLRGGQRQGTVEICLSGLWGTVCDNSWDSRDASVVCRQLGYPLLGAIPLSNAYYGSGTGPILIDYVSCTGNEQFLANCTNRGIGVTSSSCGHDDDASVQCPDPIRATTSCTNGAVRLVGGGLTVYNGRVEICHNNQWGTVCDNSFTSTDAKVVCGQLGYPRIGATAYSNAHFGRGNGGIFLDYVGCRGTESSLLSCSNQGIGVHSCQHSEDAGVGCRAPANCNEGQIRLAGSRSSLREGRVEICIDRVWGTVCGRGWDSREARVVCRQLGYTSLGAQSFSYARYGSGTGPSLLDRLGCTGSEKALLNCSHTEIGGFTSYYCYNDDVGVRCQASANCTDGQIRLRGGTSMTEGRVEICYDKTWGTICDTSWDYRDAQVACRQLGFPSIGARSYYNAYFGYGTGYIHLDRLGCTGREQALINCSHSGLRVTSYYCGHDDDAGIRCFPPFVPDNCTEGNVRLLSGFRNGTVQVCVNRTWGSICDSGWSSQDADVVCRQLGFTTIGVISHSNSFYGNTSGPMWIDNVRCTGSENSILNCTHNGIGVLALSCDHMDESGVECPVPVSDSNCTNGSLRLVDGITGNEGRVEICYNNQWGTVCDNSFTSTDAKVVCRQLGYPVIGATAFSNAHFGSGSGGIFLDYVGCRGTESSLLSCSNQGIGVHSCQHGEDVGVRCLAPANCNEGQIRLAGSRSSLREGRVEICIDRVWGTVCDRRWDSREARVVCRQLGYTSLGAQSFSYARYGSGTGPSLLDRLGCTGSEKALLNCSHTEIGGFTSYYCYNDDVGVRCQASANCTDGQIRLRGGTSMTEGRVEICYDKTWGTICDTSWDYRDAQVACRQLGFPSIGARSYYNAYFGYGTGYIHLDRLGCTGREQALINCSHSGLRVTSYYCGHDDDAGIRCFPPFVPDNCTEGNVRLLSGFRNGTVQVCVNRTWGSICDSGWSSQDADVVCRQLGFTTIGVISHSNSFYGNTSGPMWIDNVRCTGSENSILNCTHNGIGVLALSCDHMDESGVECPVPVSDSNCTNGSLRLVDGITENEGRVEICYNNQWGTVCDNSFTSTDAKVVCRQLGYPVIGATAFSNAHFGSGSGGIFLDYVGCRGTESFLLSCSNRGIGVHSCQHSEDVGVRCAVPANCSQGQIRLVGGSSQREGRVEICVDRLWGTVCGRGWDRREAQVVCRQLGHTSLGAQSFSYARYGSGTLSPFLDWLGCTGSEKALLNCSHTEIGGFTSYYCYNDDVGVRCQASANCTDGQIRLRGGTSMTEGRVEICYDKTWGTICDTSWDYRDAQVACRQLGFPSVGARSYYNAYFGYGTGYIHLDRLGCTGREQALINCSHSGLRVTSYYCGHDDDAGIRCFPPFVPDNCTEGNVRLLSGFRNGTVQVCVNRTWGSICDSGWSSQDADVVCRQLGFTTIGAISYSNSFYGNTSGPMWIDNVRCTGSENSILNCTHNGIGVLALSCDHMDGSGVECPVPVSDSNCTNGSLRLVDGITENEGRVEICYNNQWGTVCDNSFTSTDAKVVCRQLGYPVIGATAFSNAHFGSGSGGIFLDYVGCRGTESSLLSCSNRGIGVHSCQHGEDVGVRCPVPVNCSQGQIRLRGGSSLREGRVEICYGRVWGTVCDTQWDNHDAQVVCRQLGYTPFGAMSFVNAHFGQGTGPLLLDRLSCTGREQTLLSCSHRGIEVTSYYCGHDDDAGVRCQVPANCTNGQIRLRGGTNVAEGRVEICYDRAWGTICDTHWGNSDAQVVCRQLGFLSTWTQSFSNAHFGQGTGPLLLDRLSCTGREQTLLSCSHSGIGVTSYYCGHDDDAGVRCQVPANCTNGELRLRGGANVTEGRVEICINRVWGTICDTQWDYRDVQVVCRQLGFPSIGVETFINAHFGQGTGPLLLDWLSCTGTEQTLLSCSHSGIGVTSYYCGHDDDAGVRCQVPANCTSGELRLRGGANVTEGRVEICINRVWGTICDTQWDYRDVQVVCRQLGFPSIGVETFINAHFGQGTGPLLLDWLSCTGTEQTLLNCSHSGIGVTSYYCGHDDDVGVRCLAPFVPDNCTEDNVRLLFGSTTRSGTVQVCVNDTWGSICDRSWDSRDATVTCRQLGFTTFGAIPYYNSFYGRASGPIWFDYVRCTGSEDSILNCTHNGMDSLSSLCTHGRDAGVECPIPVSVSNCTNGSLRLMGGLTAREGRVEVCYNNQWGTVCDDSWGSTDAGVACRQLGFPSYGATSYSNSILGRGTGGIFLDNLYCTGRESRLVDCSHSGIGVHNCNHSADAGLRCQARNCFVDEAIRLRGGTTSREGRVEMCSEGVWGTVCDDGWDTSDARVVCRQLGYSTTGVQAYSYAHFGRGTGPILVSYLRCTGQETHLANCTHSTPFCSHSEDAGVRCLARTCFVDGAIRLGGGTSSREGRVEMCLGGVWGTICDDGWSTADARVVCRQLGYPTIGAQAYSNAYFGGGTGPILMASVSCHGEETHLANCTHSTPYCSHSEDAGVRCPVRTGTTTNCTDGELRLRGGSTSRRGRVEMCYEGQWGTVCDDSWGTNDAKVACRQLGFSSYGATAYSSAYFGRGTGPILLDDVGCTGGESRLLDCSSAGVGNHNCGHSEDAGVRCSARGTECSGDGIIRLRGGLLARQGRVEICVEGRWGTVCDTNWDSRDAAVVCRQLGYPSIGSVAYSNARFGSQSGPIWLDSLSCTGIENNLLNCSHSGIGITSYSCGHDDDVGVQCPAPSTTLVCCNDGDIRLVGGSVATEGRVEICYNNQWGTVCDDSFGSPEATVVCRQLGYSTVGAAAFSYSRFGGGTGGIFLDDLGCLGTESRLFDCTHPAIGYHNCDHYADAGVRCQGSTTVSRVVRVCPTTIAPPQMTPTPTTQLTIQPTTQPTIQPTSQPTSEVTSQSTSQGTSQPTSEATSQVTSQPTQSPTPCFTFGVRLVNGTNEHEGRVEICFNNRWGTVCDQEWDAQDAAVVCRQLGFSPAGAVALPGAHFGKGLGPIVIESAQCTGDEEGLHRCFQTRSQSCSHYNDAAVRCSDQSTVPTLIPVVQVTDDLSNMAVVTVVMQSNQWLDRQSVESIITTIETYISNYCSRNRCNLIAIMPTDGSQRSTRVAGVDIHVVNITTTDSRRFNMSFYVTLFRETLSADSLEMLLKGASTLNATLSQSGVTLVKVYRPNIVTSTPNQSPEGSTNHQVVILGVLLGVAGGVILIGTLACFIIAGLIYRKRTKQRMALLQATRQQQENEYSNALYEGTGPSSFQAVPFIESDTSATAAAISKHQEAQLAQPVPNQPPPYEA